MQESGAESSRSEDAYPVVRVLGRSLQLFVLFFAASNGRPSIGAVPGVDGLLVAAGHEGSGLCMVSNCFRKSVSGFSSPFSIRSQSLATALPL
jgi:hypothetical protein